MRITPQMGIGNGSLTLGGVILTSPIVVNSVIYVGAEDGKLYAFDARNGRQKWIVGPVVSTDILRDTRLAVATGVVYVLTSSVNARLSAFDAATGKQQWTVSVDGNSSSLVAATGIIYVSTYDGHLYAFDAITGQQQWAANDGHTNMEEGSSLAVTIDAVYVCFQAFQGGGLYAFDAITGQQQWSTPLPDPQYGCLSPVVVANGVIYAGDKSHLCAFDAMTGQQQWSTQILTTQPVVIANGVVYVLGSIYHELTAFGLSTSNLAK